MKAATILPQEYLHLIGAQDYHMALAHLINKQGFERYTEFYRQMGENPAKFLMLDTGLIEGDPRPTTELIEKAKYLSADEMALNDVFMDREATLAETYEALNAVKQSGLDIRTMGIPQGNCIEDWVLCVEEMVTWDIDTIGIPKVLFKLEGMMGRVDALRNLGSMFSHLDVKKDIHLLGCWETPLELSLIASGIRDGSLVPVRGVDSAIAYAYARANIRITDDERPEGAINFGAAYDPSIITTLEYNINVYKHEASEKPKDAKSFFIL